MPKRQELWSRNHGMGHNPASSRYMAVASITKTSPSAAGQACWHEFVSLYGETLQEHFEEYRRPIALR